MIRRESATKREDALLLRERQYEPRLQIVFDRKVEERIERVGAALLRYLGYRLALIRLQLRRSHGSRI